ncbi:MAG: metal ABC transporter ATP-binding protein [Bacilli bacterium]
MNLEIKNLNFKYKNDFILKKFNLKINNKDFLIITGHNGSGKSTLIKCILKDLIVENKTIFINGIDIKKFKNFKEIGYVPQTTDFQSNEFPITVNEFLNSFCSKTSEINNVLKKLNILKFKNTNINRLSGGEARRVFIARSILNNVKLLILDEPDIGIDNANEEKLYKFLKELNKKGLTIIVISHAYEKIDKYATVHLDMDKKVIV